MIVIGEIEIVIGEIENLGEKTQWKSMDLGKSEDDQESLVKIRGSKLFS